MKNIIIAGGRDFEDFHNLKQSCDQAIQRIFALDFSEVKIISGNARGADRLGELYADFRGLPVQKYPADWDKYGKSAGYKRNEEMAEHAKYLIAFHDGVSKGTQHMIDIANAKGLKVVTFKY